MKSILCARRLSKELKIINILFLCLVLLFCAVLAAPPLFAQEISKQNNQVDWDKKETEFLEALKATQDDNSDAQLHQTMGYWLLESDNQWKRATVYFKKAVELDPTLYRSWYGLALIYIDSNEGNEYFQKAIKANPDYPPPYYWLAYNYCRHRKDKEAIPLFEKYVEIAGSDANETGRLEVAIEILRELHSGEEGEKLKSMRSPDGK